MLADYRAKGGRVQQRESMELFSSVGTAAPVISQGRVGDATVKLLVKTDSEEEKPGKQSDINWAPKVSSVETVIFQRHPVAFLFEQTKGMFVYC